MNSSFQVAAHFTARVTHKGALEDEHRRVDGVVLRHVGVEQVARGAEGRLRQVLQSVGLCH